MDATLQLCIDWNIQSPWVHGHFNNWSFFRSLLNLVRLHGLLNWWKIHIHTTPFQSADSWLDAFYWTNVQYKLQTTSVACLWAVATTITRAEQESYAMIWNLNHQTAIPSTRQGHQNLHGRLDELRAVINSLTHIDAEARIELRTKGGATPDDDGEARIEPCRFL